MDNQTPYEIIAAPFTLWVAVVGTAFPDVDEAPAGGWSKVGTSGELNYTEDGVTVEHSQTLNYWKSLGSTGPRKAFRSEEELKVSMTLADLSLEQYARAIENAITTVAAGVGVPGTKKIGLSKTNQVKQLALLVRGPSPYGDEMSLQYEVPVAVQSGNPKPVMRKNDPAALALEYTALEDPAAASDVERFGRIVAQTAPAS